MVCLEKDGSVINAAGVREGENAWQIERKRFQTCAEDSEYGGRESLVELPNGLRGREYRELRALEFP